jgi:hypothetical protein
MLWSTSGAKKKPIERKRSIGCPLSFDRRPLLSNKKQIYVSTTGEAQKEALRTLKTTDYGQLTHTSNRVLARLGS